MVPGILKSFNTRYRSLSLSKLFIFRDLKDVGAKKIDVYSLNKVHMHAHVHTHTHTQSLQ